MGGSWSSLNNVFERLTDFFRSDLIEMFGDDILLLGQVYKLASLEEREAIENSFHDMH